MTDRPSVAERLEQPGLAIALCVLVYLPFTLLGYGTDIDVSNVLESGRGWLDDGEYAISRAPGAVVHEVSTALLDALGGSVLVNLASVLFAACTLWGVYVLLRREGSPVAGLTVIVAATNPWFWIAATSLGDFVWALGLLMAGAVAARRDHRIASGLLFALAIGCRLSTVFLVVAWLLAERTGDPSERPSWRASVTTAAVALVVGALCFVPSWLALDRTFDFLESNVPFDGLPAHLGRSAIKNAAYVGVLAAVVLLVGVPRLLRAVGAWRTSITVRFGIAMLVLSELLFLRFPFKITHLLPAGIALALVIGHVGASSRRWIAALVVAQLIGGVVTTTLGAPDVEDRATSGSIGLGLTDGPVLTDVRCRLDDRTLGPYEDDDPEGSDLRSVANARCLIQTWRSDE